MGSQQGAGIYMIENTKNGKVYIGQTKKLNRRKNYHFRELKRENHRNPYLQRSFNSYGREAFRFVVLENCDDSDNLTDKEQKWIDRFDSLNKEKGYNLSDPEDPTELKEETLERMSESMRGMRNPQTKVDPDKIRKIKTMLLHSKKTQKEIASRYDVAVSTVNDASRGEYWTHIGSRRKDPEELEYPLRDGTIMDDDVIQRMSESQKGITHDEETKQKIGDSHRGEKSPRTSLTKENVKYIKRSLLNDKKNAVDLAKEFGVTKECISNIKRGETWSHVTIEDEEELRDVQNKKLTREDVVGIKKELKYGDKTQREIADEFGVGQQNISRINTGKNWSGVEIE